MDSNYVAACPAYASCHVATDTAQQVLFNGKNHIVSYQTDNWLC
jgi:predicted RNase H-like HicB family nuclease